MQKLEEDYIRRGAWGLVASIDLHHCASPLIRDPRTIKKFIVALCREIKMRRYGPPLIKKFGAGTLLGYSAMQFIETSSITCHFDEPENRAFIDIFSCKYFNPKQAERFCRKFFRAKRARVRHFLRT